MIWNEITLNGSVKLHDLGTIEKIEYNNLSNNILYLERALRPPVIQGRKRELKEVTVSIRVISDTRQISKKKIDEIVGLSYSESPFLFNKNGKFCNAILEEAESELFFQNGLLVLKFINMDGVWYGEEKTTTSLSITNNGVIATDNVIVKVAPTGTDLTLKNGLGKSIIAKLYNTMEVTIDLKNKTIMQAGKHVELDLSSNFFELQKGANSWSITGGTATVIYREVVAL